MLRLPPLPALLVALAATWSTACGSQTVRGRPGAADASDELSPTADVFEEFPTTTDVLPPPPDLPTPFDVLPPPPDRPPPPDVPFPPDFPSPPDVPLPPDVPFPPDLPIPPDDAANVTCGNAEVLPAGVDAVRRATFTEATVRLPACGSAVPFGGPVRFYRTTLAPGQSLEVSATRASLPPLIRFYADCLTNACLAQGITTDGTTFNARWANTTPAPRDVVVAIAWNSFSPFPDLMPVTFRFRAPAANATCAGATALTPGVPLPGQDLITATTPSVACPEVPGASNPALWYRVSVPANQVLAVTSVGDAVRGANILRLFPSCMGFSCLAGSGVSFDGRTSTARWNNTSPMAREVLVAVSSPLTSRAPPFTLTASLAAPPTNLTCDRATDVADGTVAMAQDVSAASILAPPCPGMTGVPALPVLFYRATVPVGQTLFVNASPSGGMAARATPILRVVPDCTLTTCLAASTPVAAGMGSVAWTNPSMMPQRVIVTFGANPTAGAVPTDLTFRIRPPAANAACTAPIRVMDGTSLPGENLTEARELVRACSTAGTEGPVLYYTARVGAGQQLIATAARVDGPSFQPIIRLTDACASLTCLGASTFVSGPTGPTARVVYTNDGPARDVLILLSSNNSLMSAGRATLNVQIATPPYAISRIPTACDDMTTATVVSEAVGDDTGSPSFPLPFTFTHFGERMTAWSVSTNGYLQVWSMGGRSTGALGATDFPNPSAPLSAISPFWDDLEVRSPSTISSRFVTAAPRHFTVAWNNLNFCCGGTSIERVTFQAKLFETGVVEFHYCALTPGAPRAAAGSASIGMQNSTGSRGVTFALRRAGAADATSAIRFTPAP